MLDIHLSKLDLAFIYTLNAPTILVFHVKSGTRNREYEYELLRVRRPASILLSFTWKESDGLPITQMITF